MKINWGNNNQSLTLSVTGTGVEQHDEVLFLSILEKQVCDREILRLVVRGRISEAQKKMHAKCNEVLELKMQLKDKTLIGRIRKLLGI